MIAYATNELISSSDFAKKFGTYLSQIKSSTVDKLAILKNNKVEAVLVSKDEYERMKEALEFLEHQEIYQQVKQRVSEPDKTVSQEELAEIHQINLNELN